MSFDGLHLYCSINIVLVVYGDSLLNLVNESSGSSLQALIECRRNES